MQPLTRTAAWLGCAALALGQARPAPPVPAAIAGEGPLGNDVFLPRSEAALRRMTEGDRAWARARAQEGLATAVPLEALEAWRAALAESEPGDAVPGGVDPALEAVTPFAPDPEAPERRTEAVEEAVLRRLLALSSAERARWSARFEPLAAAELARAGGDEPALARVEHRWPMTPSGLRAALRQADLALERGDPEGARAWIERAGRHAQGEDGPAEPVAAALERRRAALASPAGTVGGTAGGPAGASPPEPWRETTRLARIAGIPLGAEGGTPSRSRRGVLPGAVFDDDGTLWVQTEERLLSIGPDGRAQATELGPLGAAAGWSWIDPFNDPGGEWTLVPAAAPGSVCLVAGRAAAARGNVLLCLSTGDAAGPGLRWGFGDGSFVSPAGDRSDAARVLGEGLWGFEPGPRIAGSLVLVQARHWEAGADEIARIDERRTRAFALAFDLASGALRWKRLVASGPDLRSSRADARPIARGVALAAPPLALAEGRLLVATELGALALLDVADGRPSWTIATRRAEPAGADPEEGPLPRAAREPVLVAAGRASRDTRTWIAAPADSDRIYRLENGARLGREGPIAAAPELRDRGTQVEGADSSGLYLSRPGERGPRLERVDPQSGARTVVIAFAREELPGRGVLLAEGRLFHASSRSLYVLDPRRGDALLFELPLERSAPEQGGARVLAREDRIAVVDRRSVVLLRSE